MKHFDKEYQVTLSSPNQRVYLCKDIKITEIFTFDRSIYPLMTDEILTVVDGLGLLNSQKLAKITIHNYKLVNIQAHFNTLAKELVLNIPSELAEEQRQISIRENAIFTLLHECKHIMGEINEGKCDIFAAENFDKK